MAVSAILNTPDGFGPFEPVSPFLSLIGPVFARTSDDQLTMGMRIEERHCNRRGTAHGGLLVTLADILLGYTAGHGSERGLLTTSALAVEFLGGARQGDWVEGSAEVLKIGRRLANARCLLSVDGRPILHASGSFSVG